MFICNLFVIMGYCIDKLYRRLWSHYDIVYENRMGDMDHCTICQDSLSKTFLMLKKCKHVFHYECLKEWNNEYRQTCPNCRKDIGYVV